jgi:hypothetical protein
MRAAGRIKMGYFPLPIAEGPRIRARLSFSERASAVDPCAGTGAALLAVTSGAEVERYAVELDTDRAAACAAHGITTIHGNTLDVRGSEGFSLLYLNPPYDFEAGVSGNQRLEKVFLQHTCRWLARKGVLVLVIPTKALAVCARTLATRFSGVEIRRLTDPESTQYDQVVVFGIRKDQSGPAAEKTEYFFREVASGHVALSPLVEDELLQYPVPRSGPSQLVNQGLDLDQVEDLANSSPAWLQLRQALLPRETITSGTPITPLHGGHVGLLCTAGLLNGVFGSGEDRHIAQWRTQKVSTVHDDGVDEDGATVTRVVERFSNDLALIYRDGRVRLLTAEAPKEESDGAAGAGPAEGAAEAADGRSVRGAVVIPFEGTRFPLGRTVMTRGIQELVECGLNVSGLLERHAGGDWGDVGAYDWQINDDALENDGRILSSYKTEAGEVWIITEADRSATTVLLPDEY